MRAFCESDQINAVSIISAVDNSEKRTASVNLYQHSGCSDNQVTCSVFYTDASLFNTTFKDENQHIEPLQSEVSPKCFLACKTSFKNVMKRSVGEEVRVRKLKKSH